MKRQKSVESENVLPKSSFSFKKQRVYMDDFSVQDKIEFEGSFPYFRQPKEVGYFSLDKGRSFHSDKSSMKHLVLPKDNEVSLSIWTDYELFQSRDETVKEYLDHMLQWISSNKDCFIAQHSSANNAKPKSLNTDFISWRGLLTKILSTPYEYRDGWKISCNKIHDTIYMCEYDTEERKRQKEGQTMQQKVMTYGGFKFEQYLCSDNADTLPDTSEPVNNSEAFCSVVRTRLQHHSLVYGGEVDCCENAEKSLKYVELKTSREIYNWKQDENFKKFKLLKWWIQSFLIGIEKIICGFRNDDGIVERLETFYTSEIPKMCKGVNGCWKANVCFNFLNKFLQHVKDVVSENNSKVAYIFEYTPKENITIKKETEQSEYLFLPSWYCDSFGKDVT